MSGKKRKAEKRQEAINRDPGNAYIDKHLRFEKSLIFVMYERKVEGIITRVHQYEIEVKGQDSLLPKIDILYMHNLDLAESIEEAMEIDKDVVDEDLKAIRKPRKRLKVSNEILEKCFQEKRQIEITLRNGHVFKGRIYSYGVFSIRLELGPDDEKIPVRERPRIIIMRSNIYDLDYRVRVDPPSGK